MPFSGQHSLLVVQLDDTVHLLLMVLLVHMSYRVYFMPSQNPNAQMCAGKCYTEQASRTLQTGSR